MWVQPSRKTLRILDQSLLMSIFLFLNVKSYTKSHKAEI